MQPDDSQRLDILAQAFDQLRQNQKRLEQRLARLEEGLAPPPAKVAVEADVQRKAMEAVRQREDIAAPLQREEESGEMPADGSTLESKVGLTLVNRIGAITLVLGVAFFFKWAVDNNWIGPAGRIVLGLIAGFATLAAGDLLWRKRQRVFAQGITATGIAIIFLALYAAFSFYHLIPQAAAFATMAAATVMAAALALRYHSFAVAALGLAAGYATPLLLSTGEDHSWFLFGYVLLLNAAATELAKRRQWRGLETISFIATVLIYGGWLLSAGSNPERHVVASVAALAFCAERSRTQMPALFAWTELLTALAIAFIWPSDEAAFFGLELLIAAAALVFAHVRHYRLTLVTTFAGFWLSCALHLMQSHEPLTRFLGVTCGFGLFLAWSWRHLIWKRWPASSEALSVFALDGFAYYANSYLLLRSDHHLWLGPLALLAGMAYLVFGLLLQRQATEQDSEARSMPLALGIAVSFLTLAIPIELTGFSITIAWALQGAALSWIGYRAVSTRACVAALLVFALAGLRLLVFEVGALPDPESYSVIWNARFLTFSVSAVAMLLAAWWAAKIFPLFALAAYYAGHAFLLLGACLEIMGWAGRSVAAENRVSAETIGVSILFGVYAVILVSVGVATGSTINRVSGLGLTGIVVLKLYLFDVWQLTRPYQISAFVILGILLLATSFLYSHFRRLIESWWKDEKSADERAR
jgi:uncharacterized membrane protein